jgi:putative GTP pyrophosphokinase
MAGSADEMSSFVRNLTSEITIQELKIDAINREQELHLSEIEALASELSNEKSKNKHKNKDSKVNKLNDEIKKLRTNSQTRTLSQHNSFISEDLIAKIAAINANILGGNSAAKIAAMNASILGENSVAKIAAMNANILVGNSAAKLTDKVISTQSTDEKSNESENSSEIDSGTE